MKKAMQNLYVRLQCVSVEVAAIQPSCIATMVAAMAVDASFAKCMKRDVLDTKRWRYELFESVLQ